jgi:hypothetical protein
MVSSGNHKQRTIKEMAEEWKIIKNKNNVMLEIEERITEHQAFIFSILRNRVEEVKKDFQRKAFTYWKLDEVINFLDKEAKKFGYEKNGPKVGSRGRIKTKKLKDGTK